MLKEVRDKFLDFFKSKEHLVIKSASLLAKNDPTLLFINSGMAPMKKYFLKEKEPLSKCIANSQKCLRVGGKHNDLAEIGYTKRHHTFFEMLGNFSFGAYGQQEAIKYAWEFLTQVLAVDKNRLYITVHPDDSIAYEIWSKLVPADKIIKLKENIWSIGKIGPFGYCTEIFYDQKGGEGVFDESDRYLEIWNIVFMKFYTDGKEKTLLPELCIDAGMGLERIVSVLENVDDTYEISFFKQSLKIIGKTNHTIDTKIFLDHMRSVLFILHEGINPSSNECGYVLRRIIRRMLKSFFNLEIEFEKNVKNLISFWAKEYNIEFNSDKVIATLSQEKTQFEEVLKLSILKFDELIKENKEFSGENLFLLHDTYGLPVDISVDLLKARNIKYDLARFEKIMQESKEKSKKEGQNQALPYKDTQFIDLEVIEANIIGIEGENVVLDKSNFYAESGGQIGDVGFIQGQGFKIKIIDTKKHGNVFLHKFEGIPKLGKVVCKIDVKRRKAITIHHSSTHILHHVLSEILGDEVQQMGSYVSENKLRLDFSYSKALTKENIRKIEKEVNNCILKNHSTKTEEMEFEKALQTGAKAYFNYGETVRVVKIGDSVELCGGTHVKASGNLGFFKIIKTSSVSAGVKRIEAIAGAVGYEYIFQKIDILDTIAEILKVQENEILKKITQKNPIKESVQKFIEEINGKKIGFFISDSKIKIEDEMLKESLDMLCNCVENDNKISLYLKTKTHNAKELILKLGEVIDAKGAGGRADYAQTGGKSISDKTLIFAKMKELT